MLTFSQIIFYIENGYLVVSGLIPDDIVVRSEQAMWNCMGLDIHKPHDWPGSFSGSALRFRLELL